MATCKDFNTGSDQITKLCNLCDSNVSDGYCDKCEDHMCQSCFDIHSRVRTCRHHVLLNDECQKDNRKAYSEPCKRHPNQSIKFYCVADKIVGCVECFFPEHRNCHYQNIEDAAKIFQDSGEDTRLKNEIHRLENTHSEYTRQLEEDKETVAVINNTVVNAVESFTDSVTSYVTQVEKHMLEQSERLRIENETRLERRSDDLDSVGTEIEKCKLKLENEDRVDRLFISAIEIGPAIEKLGKNIASIGCQHVVTKYEFQPNKLIMEMTNGSGSFGDIYILPGEKKPGPAPETNFKADTKQQRFMEPGQQDMEDREATGIANKQEAMTDLSWNTNAFEVTEDLMVLLSVTNIPKDTTRDDLLSEFQCNRNTGPRLAYLKESGKALLIFNNTGDMDYFKYRPKKYQYDRVTKMGSGNISSCVNAAVWKKLGTDATDKLEQDWNDIGVTITKNNGVLKAPTAYQMGVAKRILDEFIANKDRECEIADVPALVWRTVSALHRQRITDIEMKCGNKIIFSEEKAVVRFPAMDKSLEASITALRKEVDDMKKMEIIDITLIKEELERGEDACKHMGKECCIFDKTSKTVFIYSDSFDKLQKHKFQFEIKIGRKRTTARSDRARQEYVDQASSENKKQSGANVHRSFLEKKTFNTEGINVMVYKANILTLDVDCIVNAANSRLQHGGGVARVIAEAAGDNFASECKQYIRDHGLLPVGQAYSTTAGKLNYKCVIHTVGPSWHDYDTKRYNGRKACEDDLKQFVLNSFYEAEKLGLKSIGLPAISSAIFGVPIEVCVKQYVRAVKEYSYNKRGDLTSGLSEIHFIDVNERTVCAIQSAFKELLSYGSSYNTKASDGSTFNWKQKPEPLMCESNLHEYQFYFMGNMDSNMLLLCKKDIEDIDGSSAVVVPVDQYGKGGHICKTIENKVKYIDQYKGDKGNLFRAQVTVGQVLKNSGYGCGFRFVLYAVYPHGERSKQNYEREKSLANILKNVLSQTDTDKNIQSVVIPLFGIEPDNESDVQLFSSVFVRTYKQFCDEKLKERRLNPLSVTVGCHTDRVFKEAQHVFAEYVKKLKDENNKANQEGASGNNAEPSSTNADESEGASMETCVICMDTLTDPKTIQCGHTFCTECIDEQFKYKEQCPTCGKVCGTITGDQPEGTMTSTVRSYDHLPGYEGCGSIAITYNFPGGRQESNHPSPGTWYKGITRTAYLPNNYEGKTILKMLNIAFKRKVTFTIGNSRTTGQQGVITWNDIHHKTDHRPDTQFGYPDPTYLARVKDELAAKGVTEEDIINT